MTTDELNRRIHELLGFRVEAVESCQVPIGDVCDRYVEHPEGTAGCSNCWHPQRCHAPAIPDYTGSLDVTVAAIDEWADQNELTWDLYILPGLALLGLSDCAGERTTWRSGSEKDARALAAAFCAALEALR